MRACASCGNRIPEGAAFCQRCGAAAVEAVAQSPLEEKVYHYIVKHEGVISLSKASTDLGISVEQLETITARLKKEGRLA
jgi:predicted amidophosphoribosyltransferase